MQRKKWTQVGKFSSEIFRRRPTGIGDCRSSSGSLKPPNFWDNASVEEVLDRAVEHTASRPGAQSGRIFHERPSIADDAGRFRAADLFDLVSARHLYGNRGVVRALIGIRLIELAMPQG
jgi:hypothetical protein